MGDLDHFKAVNDRYGHLAGDEVLRVFGALLTNNARASDIACRYGGEEFLLVLPGMTARGSPASAPNNCDKQWRPRLSASAHRDIGHRFVWRSHISSERPHHRRADRGGGQGVVLGKGRWTESRQPPWAPGKDAATPKPEGDPETRTAGP